MLVSAIRTVSLVAAVLCFGASCSLPQSHRDEALANFIVHLDYRSGGDAPVGFLMTVMADGRVRFLSPDWETYWRSLSEDDMASALAIFRSSELSNLAAHLEEESGNRFGCCDAKELGVYLSSESEPIGVNFEVESSRPAVVLALVQFVNEIGKKYFRERYSLPLPVVSLEAGESSGQAGVSQ